MFRIPAVGALLSANRMPAKLLTTISGLHVSASMRLKEIQATKEGNKTVIQGVLVPSPRTKYLVRNNSECSCPLSALNLNVKHTDVLILSQFVRPDGCMMPRRITGLSRPQQKIMSKLVSMAHKAGLMSNLAPENSKNDPTKRKNWKKFNTYFDESTIKVYESHFTKLKKDTILDYMKYKNQK